MNIADKDIRKRAADPTVSAVVSAPAGAGKTSVLLLRLLNCLAVSERPEHVAAITFTNKAVNEIRERVIGALHLAGSTPRPERDYEADIWDAAQAVLKVDRERDWNLAANPSRLRISTFDSFCRALIQRLPVLAGSTLGQVSEHASLLYREAVLELLADIEGDDIDEQTRDALEVVLGFSNNRTEDVIPILSSLLRKRDQWAASVLTLDMATMEQALSDAVLSEYGRVLGILRGHDFEQVAQAYITASSESETLSWAAEGVLPLDDSPQSIHFVQKVAGSLLKTDGDLRKSVTKREGFEAKKAGTAEANAWVKPFDGQPPPALLDALRRAARLPSPVIDGDTQLLLENLVVLMRRLLPTLKLIFDRTGQCDFVEMALAAVQSLGDGVEQYGDALLQEDRIQHLMVDEMQDTSWLQYQLLERLCQLWEDGDGRSIFFCGDGAQSIYRFRNAAVELFTQLQASGRFCNKTLERLALTTNFRSAPAIVDWVNGVFQGVFSSGESPVVFTQAMSANDFAGEVAVHPFVEDDGSAEAAEMVEVIRRIQERSPGATIAVLVRARQGLKHLVPAMKAAGIPFSGQDIDKIVTTPAVSDVLSLVRAVWHEGDRVAWLGVLRSPMVGLTWEDCHAVALAGDTVIEGLRAATVVSPQGRDRIDRFLSIWDQLSMSPRAADLAWMARSLWYSLGGYSGLPAHEVEDVDRVFELARKHTELGALVDLRAFNSDVDDLYAASQPSGVQLMTIHKSKGLEFDHVLVAGMGAGKRSDSKPLFQWRRFDQGFLIAPRPPKGADPVAEGRRYYEHVHLAVQREELAEIDRIAYVAATRAKRTLHLFGSVAAKEESREAVEGSLLATVWPAVRADFADCDPIEADEASVRHTVPAVTRFEQIQVPVLSEPVFVPLRDADSVVNESVLASQDAFYDGFNNIADRAVGLVYHRLMESVAKLGLDAWPHSRLDIVMQSVIAQLRQEGHPEGTLVQGAERVKSLALATLSSDRGQWILRSRTAGGAELAISGYKDQAWFRFILDRAFVEDRTFWVIDYKTGQARDGQSIPAFLEREQARYAPKMKAYEAAVWAAGLDADQVKSALYYPAHDAFVEI